ncbi:hypothetical protein NM962_08700 [Mycobacterium sp. SVM_VP21]|nr:hypothetical protein NM962_08700 [Mycobacterium sp. SVM_VP21]
MAPKPTSMVVAGETAPTRASVVPAALAAGPAPAARPGLAPKGPGARPARRQAAAAMVATAARVSLPSSGTKAPVLVATAAMRPWRSVTAVSEVPAVTAVSEVPAVTESGAVAMAVPAVMVATAARVVWAA